MIIIFLSIVLLCFFFLFLCWRRTDSRTTKISKFFNRDHYLKFKIFTLLGHHFCHFSHFPRERSNESELKSHKARLQVPYHEEKRTTRRGTRT